jgi:hypothetical protein
LIRSGNSVLLRVESRTAKVPFPHLDRTSTFEDNWGRAERSEATGTASAATPPFTIKLTTRFGPRFPDGIALTCANRTINVHPAFATLAEGWKRSDDSMESAVWAPPRVEKVQVLGCRVDGAGDSFSDGLSFAKPKAATEKEPAYGGVDWAFVSSDMVIQEGGYRWFIDFGEKP